VDEVISYCHPEIIETMSLTLTGDHQGLVVYPKHRQCMQEVVVHFWPTVLILITG
jgi:hypothetical protein